MKIQTRHCIVLGLLTVFLTVTPLFAGDMYWSPVPNLTGVNDFAVCGTIVYAATETGLFRSDGDPETWTVVRPVLTKLVDCSGARVIWEETVGVTDYVYVSADGMLTFAEANGLDNAISSGIRDLAIAGNTALVATLWGVDRSTDGGFNFPSAVPVLWESSAGYQITAVWTNGTACAAAGSGGAQGNGIWRSASGDAGTWSLVLNVGGQEWLNGSGSNTIVSGRLYSNATDSGYVSTDAGATWSPLPSNWGAVGGNYQRPFISETRILSRHVYEEFDPGSGQFITYTYGPLLYDTAAGAGNDLDPSLPSEAELLNQAIVETSDPFMLVAERSGAVYWFRVPGGWPAGDFDFTPPYSPSLNASPRIGSQATALSLHPTAGDATWMYVEEIVDVLSVTYDVNGFWSTTSTYEGPTTGGWVSYSTSLPWDIYSADGLHSFYAWYADSSGNITDPGVISGFTSFPPTLNLGSGGAWGTWMYAKAGESFTIGGSGTGGDIDVYHWEPGSTFSDDWATASNTNDVLAFTARETGFHAVILLNYPGAGAFNGSLVAQLGLLAATDSSRNVRSGEQMSGDAPDETLPPYYSSTEVTQIFADGFESNGTSNWSSTTQ